MKQAKLPRPACRGCRASRVALDANELCKRCRRKAPKVVEFSIPILDLPNRPDVVRHLLTPKRTK